MGIKMSFAGEYIPALQLTAEILNSLHISVLLRSVALQLVDY
jgi:hypothetical protein